MAFPDQLRILSLRRRVTRGSLADLYARPERTTLDRLRALGFGAPAIERFFRPFFAGVFLERELDSSSRFFEFAFRHFALGDAALPAEGIGAIPQQLAARLPEGTVACGAPVEAIEPGALHVAGERIEAAAVVVATDGEAARRFAPSLPPTVYNETSCLWFACAEDPVGEPLLVLDADASGPVNHLCVPSAVAPAYAPAGQALVAASVVGAPPTADLEPAVRAQLRGWFGAAVSDWRLLRIDRIERALPRQPVGRLDPVEREVAFGPRLFVAGDHRDMASLHGALRSGRRAARAVMASLGLWRQKLAS
jgi:phytoene dehydrogenase-like protein